MRKTDANPCITQEKIEIVSKNIVFPMKIIISSSMSRTTVIFTAKLKL